MLERFREAADKAFKDKTTGLDTATLQSVEKQVLLQIIDTNWREHLQHLDHLKSVIGWRSYGQRDPLNEYKSEAFTLFDNLLTNLREGVTRLLMNLQIQQGEPEPEPAFNPNAYEGFNPGVFEDGASQPPLTAPLAAPMAARSPQDMMAPTPNFDVSAFEKEHGRIPRNAPCPCGSGKKFKHCHGKIG